MDFAERKLKNYHSIDYQTSDVLIRRVESDQSFLELRKSELEQIKDNIFQSLIDLRAEVYHDENEKTERQNLIDQKMATLSSLEIRIHELELECQRINKQQLLAAEAVKSERLKLRKEVDELLEYRRKMDEKRLIRELVYDVALPNEMMNFEKIEKFLNAHQLKIEKLERMKIGQTPSQIQIINKQIAELEAEFNEKLNDINFQCDENGRNFYYDSNGNIKFVNEFRILMDQLGDYFLDLDNKKSYVREYANDENGRYYLDDDDNRIYKATPYSPECRLFNGVLIRINNKPEEISPPSSLGERRESEINSLVIGSEYLNFLMENYAEPLKKALVDITWKHPMDPTEHLQKYLGNYEKKRMQRPIDEDFFKNLERKRRFLARQIFETQLIENRRLNGSKE